MSANGIAVFGRSLPKRFLPLFRGLRRAEPGIFGVGLGPARKWLLGASSGWVLLLQAGACGALLFGTRTEAQLSCTVTWSCSAGGNCGGVFDGASSKTFSGTLSAPSKQACEATVLRSCNAANDGHCGLTPTCNCGGRTATAAAPQNMSTGSLTGDVINMGAQLYIQQHIQNPYGQIFASNFTTGFLKGFFANDTPEAQRARAAAEASLRQQQLEQAERQREAEQQRIDAMFARLNSELKLSGGTTELAMKTSAPLGELQMKLSGGASGLPMKMGDIDAGEGYGIKGLPGIYTNGAATGDATTGGLKLKTGDGNGDAATTPPAASMGISGLPGLNLPENIDLNHVTPQQAPVVADASFAIADPQQRGAVENIALQAAAKDPELNKPSDDPFAQDYQKSKKELDAAKEANATALQQASEAQGRAQADQTALAYAKQQMEANPASDQVKQAYAQMAAAAGSDEEVAVKAREMFEGTQIQLSVKRDEAVVALAGLSPPPVSAGSPTNTAGTPTHSYVTASGGSSLPLLDPSSRPRILGTPTPRPSVAPNVPPETMEACLARTSNKPSGSTVPSLEELHKKLELDLREMERLERSREQGNDQKEEFGKQVADAWEDVRMNALDHTVDRWFEISEDGLHDEEIELHGEIEETTKRVQQVRQEMDETRKAMAAAQGDPQRLAELQKQLSDLQTNEVGPLLAWRRQMEDKWSDFLKMKDRMASFTSVRDFAMWVTDNEVPCKLNDGKLNCDAFKKENSPFAKEEHNDQTARLDAYKQLAKFAMHNAEYLKYLKYVPLAVKIAENANFVAETWDKASMAVDLTFDGAALWLGYQRLQQVTQNDAQFTKGKTILDGHIERVRAEIGCYEKHSTGVTTEAAR